jgi:hypothetical protein
MFRTKTETKPSTIPCFPDIETKGFLVQQPTFSHKKHGRTVASLLFLDMISMEGEDEEIRPNTSKSTLFSLSKPSTRPTTRGNVAYATRPHTSLLTRVNTPAKPNHLRPLFTPNVSRPATTHKSNQTSHRSPPTSAASLLNLAGVFPLPTKREELMGSTSIDMLLSMPSLSANRTLNDISRIRISSPAPSLETDVAGEVGEDRNIVFLNMMPIGEGGERMLEMLVGKICTPGYIIGMCSRLLTRFRVDHATVCDFI